MNIKDKLRIRLDSSGIWIRPSKASPNKIVISRSIVNIRHDLILLNPYYTSKLSVSYFGGGGFCGIGYE